MGMDFGTLWNILLVALNDPASTLSIMVLSLVPFDGNASDVRNETMEPSTVQPWEPTGTELRNMAYSFDGG